MALLGAGMGLPGLLDLQVQLHGHQSPPFCLIIYIPAAHPTHSLTRSLARSLIRPFAHVIHLFVHSLNMGKRQDIHCPIQVIIAAAVSVTRCIRQVEYSLHCLEVHLSACLFRISCLPLPPLITSAIIFFLRKARAICACKQKRIGSHSTSSAHASLCKSACKSACKSVYNSAAPTAALQFG